MEKIFLYNVVYDTNHRAAAHTQWQNINTFNEEQDILCVSLTLPVVISLLITGTYQTTLKFRFPSYLDFTGGKVGEYICDSSYI